MTEQTPGRTAPRRARLLFSGGDITVAMVLFEVAVIVVGVLIALAASGWSERAQERRLVESVIENVRSEMAANVEQLTLATGLRREQITQLRTEGGGLTLQPAFLRRSAWQTTQSTGAAALLDFGLTAKLAEIQEVLDEYERVSQTAIQIVYYGEVFGPVFLEDPGPDVFRGFEAVLSDMLGMETALLGLYDELEALLP